MIVKFKKPKKEFLKYIAENMKDEDKYEISCLSSQTPLQVLELSCRKSSHCTVIFCNNEPVAVCGVSPHSLTSMVGCPWMLSTNSILKYKKEILKYSKEILDIFKNLYNDLENQVHIGNKSTIRWLKWLGFEFDQPMKVGKKNELFVRFYMRGNLNV